MVANVFYLTMQFYYFYGVVLIVVAASALAAERVRRLPRMTDVSVVIVSHESRELLARCLAALAADADRLATAETIVVDQASHDGTAAWLAAEHPDVRVVALSENVGFGAGNNRGAAIARGRWLLLLNSDAFVRPGAIDELVRFGEAHPAAGAVGPELLWPDGRLQRSCRRFPTVFRLATEYLYLRKLAPRSRVLNGFYCGEFAHDGRTAGGLADRGLRARPARPLRAARRLRRGLLPLLGGGRPDGARLAAGRGDVVRPGRGGRAPVGRHGRPRLGARARGAGAQPRALPRKHASRAAAARARALILAGLRLRAARAPAYREAARWLASQPVPKLLSDTRRRA